MNEMKRIESLQDELAIVKKQVSDLIIFIETLQNQLDQHKDDNHADKKPYWFDEM